LGRKYKNPPLVEVVCEIRFTPETEWKPILPGLLFPKVEGNFPTTKEDRPSRIQITPREEGGVTSKITTEKFTVFYAEDEKTLFRIGPRILAIHRLKPYPKWEEFKPTIGVISSALFETIGDIDGIQRLGLRYVNHIFINEESPELSRYFKIGPALGDELPAGFSNFLVGCTFPFNGGRYACRLHFSSLAIREPEKKGFLLDIDYFLNEPKTVEPAGIIEWVEEGHKRVEEIFEGSITDELRKIFGEVK
jgi:uncharacterized protein (TIGR04255 family)